MSDLTVGDLLDLLKDCARDTEITFGNNIFGVPIEFYRLKWRGEKLLQIELSEDFENGTYKVSVSDGVLDIDYKQDKRKSPRKKP